MFSKKASVGLLFFSFFSTLLLFVSVPALSQEPYYTFVTKWGGTGTGPGEFGSGWFTNCVLALGIDSQDNVYVVDSWNRRVQKFDKHGNYLLQWGSQGTESGQFMFPGGIAIDRNDYVYVSDYDQWQGGISRIQKFDSNGDFIASWDNSWYGLSGHLGIDIDKAGNIYVVTLDCPEMIKKFAADMSHLGGFGQCGNPYWPEGDSDPYDFVYPSYIAVNSNGDIFTAEWGEGPYLGQVKKFNQNLNFILRWYPGAISCVAIDIDDNVLVCCENDPGHGLFKYTGDGILIQQLVPNATYPLEDGKIYQPYSIAVDSEGNIYVSDILNRIQKFAPPYVPYAFDGFFPPIENAPVVNSAKAGQTIPVKWRILDKDGLPVSDPASFVGLTSYQVSCATFEGDPTNLVEESAAGLSGLQYLGDGWWQYNWKTPKSYAGQCRIMKLTLDDKSEHTASFSFK